MAVITLARQVGSGGSEIAPQVAKELGYLLVDKEIVEEAAARIGIDPEWAWMGDERLDRDTVEGVTKRIIAKLAELAKWDRPCDEHGCSDAPYWNPRWNVRRYGRVVEALIREAAARDEVVIVGRGANFVLADQAPVVRVFIGGSAERRAARLVTAEALTPEFAAQTVKHSDQQRATYIEKVYGKDWTDPMGYDLVLRTDQLDDRVVVGTIAALARAIDPLSAQEGKDPLPESARAWLRH